MKQSTLFLSKDYNIKTSTEILNCIFLIPRIKYFKRPDWFKALDDIQTNDQQEDKYLFEVTEMFKVDGNTEPFFKKKFKLEIFFNSNLFFL
jgi:hypothetical protein